MTLIQSSMMLRYFLLLHPAFLLPPPFSSLPFSLPPFILSKLIWPLNLSLIPLANLLHLTTEMAITFRDDLISHIRFHPYGQSILYTMHTFKSLFKKKVKTILPQSLGTSQSSKQSVKIKHEFAFLSQLQKCLLQGCELSHLSFVDAEDLQFMAKSTKQLMSIAELLKVQQLENNQLRTFYENNRHVVANHTSIVKGIESMYEERMSNIRQDYLKIIDEKDKQVETLKQELSLIRSRSQMLEEECSTLKSKFVEANRETTTIIFEKEKLQEQMILLRKEIQLYKSVQTNSALNVSDLSPKQPLPIILGSQVSPLILSFLSVQDILQFSLVNKVSHYIVSNSIRLNRLLSQKAFKQTQKWREETTREIKYFQSMVENINDDSIKQSALKYIYFHQKPGEYILSSLKEFSPQQQKQKQDGKKRKNSNSFFGLLRDGKDKKDESKISIKELGDPQYFKKVESKIEEYFQGVLTMKTGEPLKVFRQSMLEQYEDMKNIILNQSQIIKLYHCAKFLYLQSQQLHRFCQYLFSGLVQLSKKHQQMRSQYEDILQKQQAVKNALQIISSQKTQIQEQNWLLQYDLTKQKFSLQTLAKQIEELTKQLETLRETNEKLKVHSGQVSKKNQELAKRVGKLQKYLDSIRSLMT